MKKESDTRWTCASMQTKEECGSGNYVGKLKSLCTADQPGICLSPVVGWMGSGLPMVDCWAPPEGLSGANLGF